MITKFVFDHQHLGANLMKKMVYILVNKQNQCSQTILDMTTNAKWAPHIISNNLNSTGIC
jgi:hypothetical protein